MKAPTAITLKKEANSEKRIGPENKRSKASESSIQVEEIYLKHAPLPCTFDVSPIQQPYFAEFSYHDVFGGIMGGSMNEEVNARIIEYSIKDAVPDYTEIENLKARLADKYVLSSTLSEPDAKKIIFFPGSNLLHIVNHEAIDKILYEDESVRIKPHPIMTPDGLRMLGKRYGFWRIIPPSESGIQYLMQCEQVWTTMNSELGMICAAHKIPWIDVSQLAYMPKLTYACTQRLFKNNDLEHNYDILARILTSKKSGYLMPWHSDLDERAAGFFNHAMEIRSFFKPSWAWLGTYKNIKEK